METINFNDFSPKERHEIIKAFLVKMRGANANSMPSKDLHVQKFFEHYLRKFYKVPVKVANDIAYCQRAMKAHLATHQTIVDVFGKQDGPVAKDNYLHELQDILYQLNAECQYLVMRLQDDIDRFCLAFTEQGLKPDELVIQDIVSQSIVPRIVAPELSIKPYFVVERPTEDQLMKKYFVLEAPWDLSPPPPVEAVPAPVEPPQTLPSASAVVKASRLNLQAALKRARSQCKAAEKMPENEQPKDTKEIFLQSVGLCTHKEHQQLKLSMMQHQKRKPKPSEKTK